MKRTIRTVLAVGAGILAFVTPQSAEVAGASTTTGSSPHWAGYEIAYNMTKPGDVKINAELTVPSINCKSGQRTYSSAWVGFGGDPNWSLPQIGAEFDCVAGRPKYSIWYEWFDGAVGNTTLVPAGWKAAEAESGRYKGLQPGDKLILSMQYIPSKHQWHGLWEASFDRNGPVFKWDVEQQFGRVKGSKTRIGDTAECIVERPTGVGDKKLTLTHFSPIHFRNCVTYSDMTGIHDDIAGASQTKPDGKFSHLAGTRVVLRDKNTVLAKPELTSQTSRDHDATFVVSYKP